MHTIWSGWLGASSLHGDNGTSVSLDVGTRGIKRSLLRINFAIEKYSHLNWTSISYHKKKSFNSISFNFNHLSIKYTPVE